MSFFYNPVQLFFEEQGYDRLKQQLAKESFSRVLIISWDLAVLRNEQFQPLLAALQNSEQRQIEFKQSNPNLVDVLALKEELNDYRFDFVIAIGGGSVIDVAKALIALQHEQIQTIEELRTVVQNNVYDNITASLLAVPTTSGTGSEVTAWATIWDEQLQLKYSISHEQLMAKYALILPALTLQLPLMTTVSTAIDALCHATEAYWSKNSNPVSRAMSLEAIRLIIGQLESPHFQALAIEQRSDLALGSVLAGLAFSNTRTTACHAISYPLTMMYNIPHGIAVGLTLGNLLHVNKDEIVELDRLLAAFNTQTIEQVQQKLTAIYEKFHISSKLESYGVEPNELEQIAQRSLTKGRIDNNPVNLSVQNIEAILQAIY